MNKKYTIVSVFDGMSCGQLAANSLTKDYNYFASEVEVAPIKVTQHNFPNTNQLGDIRNVTYKDGVLHSDNGEFNIGDVYLFMGGSPCQNFSFAGTAKGMVTKDNLEITDLGQYLDLKKEGFEFEGQSYLFWEYVRLLKEIRPKYFLLENVKMAKKWQDVIDETLSTKPILINSSLVSAQNRERLYWTNIPNITQPEDKGILLKDIIDNKDKQYLSDKAIQYMSRLRNGKPRWEYHKNNYNSKVACLTANMHKGVPYGVIKQDLRFLTPIECERAQTVPDDYTKIVPKTQRLKMIGNGWTVDVIKHILKNIF